MILYRPMLLLTEEIQVTTVNLDGEVIGVNTAIYSPSGGSVGIGFAIPSSLAEGVINQLIQYGKTVRGWLGVNSNSNA